MRKMILACCIAIIMLPSCKPDYACYCYNGGVRDTIIYMGKISANEASKNCASVNSIRSVDSCVATEEMRK